MDKDDLVHLPEIVDLIVGRRERFIIFCDDLSFESVSYTHLDVYKRQNQAWMPQAWFQACLLYTSSRYISLPYW